MKISCIAAVTAALLASFISTATFAQEKTAKACRDEWKANKADNQAKGITEKAYVAQCRTDAKAATPTAAPTTTAPPSKQDTSTKPATTMPTVATPATKPQPPKPTTTAATSPAGANQFSAEAQAKARCPSDTVVWVNLKSKIYHFAATKSYGTTKNGAYMCEKDSMGDGFRAAKNEKHP
jgi:hypothetical protein